MTADTPIVVGSPSESFNMRNDPEGTMARLGGPAKCYDAVTGEYVPHVWYYDAETHEVRRYQRNAADTEFAIDPTGDPVTVTEFRRLRFEKLS